MAEGTYTTGAALGVALSLFKVRAPPPLKFEARPLARRRGGHRSRAGREAGRPATGERGRTHEC